MNRFATISLEFCASRTGGVLDHSLHILDLHQQRAAAEPTNERYAVWTELIQLNICHVVSGLLKAYFATRAFIIIMEMQKSTPDISRTP